MMKNITFITWIFFLLLGTANGQGTSTSNEIWISGSEIYCGTGNYTYQVMLPSGCTFNSWSYNGTMSYAQGSHASPFIQVTFATSGTLTANCSCGSATKQISVGGTIPSVSIAANPTTISLGQSVQLTGSGATSYQWGGEGLSSTIGANVMATPTSAGTKYYSVTGANESGLCSDTEGISVTVNFIPLPPNQTIIHCRESGNINISSLGFNLAEGQWKGPGLISDVIDISSLSNDVEYSYTYTRASDGALGSAKITIIQSIPGQLTINPTTVCEGNLTGILTLSGHSGIVARWERLEGETWTPITNTTNTFNYNVATSTSFRAVTKNGNCTEIPSEPILVAPATLQPGTLSHNISSSCTSVSGSITVNGTNGQVNHWEKTYNNGASWTHLGGTNNFTLSNIFEDRRVGFRAATHIPGCILGYTEPIYFEPTGPDPGYVSRIEGTTTCGNSEGRLRVDNFSGESIMWMRSVNGGPLEEISGATGNELNFNVTQETLFRVRVRKGTCPDEFSSGYLVRVSSIGGNIGGTQNTQCGTGSGVMTLMNEFGTVLRWESSPDQSGWTTLPDSEHKTSIQYETTAPLTYFRAVVQLGNCEPAMSTVFQLNVQPATVPGQVIFERELKDAEIINGTLTFYPRFVLEGPITGNVEQWHTSTNTQQNIIASTASYLETVVTKTTEVRAEVKNGDCPELLSGSATMVINHLYEGVIQVFDKLTITKYEGNSYVVESAEGISMQDGFSFIANSAQEFFIVLDENYAQPPSDHNYVLEETVLVEGITDPDDLYFANAFQRQSSYTYFDGIGRPMQQVIRKGSPDQKDIITPVTYDPLGRVDRDYLPYISAESDGKPRLNAVDEQLSFYLTPPEKIAASAHPFAMKVYEASPLNRVLEQGAPGTAWQPVIGQTIKFDYGTNSAEEVRIWNIDDETRLPVSPGFYDAGKLHVKSTRDEHGSDVKEYIDFDNQVVEKRVQNGADWLTTVYIYDDFGLLRYVIQPEGAKQLADNPTQTFLDMWAFQYHYDARKRMTEKRVPGSGWQYMVYDNRDRLVLSQDANQRVHNEWSFTKYADLNRPVITGIHIAQPDQPGETVTASTMLSRISTTSFTESFSIGNAGFFGYTNQVFPTSDLEVMTITYYDNYQFTSLLSDQYSFDPNALEGIKPFNDRVRSLVTGSRVRVIGTDAWIENATWYDDKYRVIQTLSSNNLGGKDRLSFTHDFTGKVLTQSHHHTNEHADSHEMTEAFIYDHSGRLLEHYHQLDDEDPVLLKNNHYNAIGQVVETNLHLKRDLSISQSTTDITSADGLRTSTMLRSPTTVATPTTMATTCSAST